DRTIYEHQCVSCGRTFSSTCIAVSMRRQSDAPPVGRQSEFQVLHASQRAAVERPDERPAEDVQSLVRDVRDYEVSPSADKGNRQTHGMELARRLKRLWHPATPGDGSWMRRR